MRRGRFTLIEIVLAVTIFAVIGGIVASILFTVRQSWEKLQENNSLLQSRLKTDQIANLVFRNAVPFYWPDPNRKDRSVFYGKPDCLILAYRHRINVSGESGIRFVRLSLSDGKLIAAYRTEPILYWETEEIPGSMTEEVITEKVKKIEFSYADKNHGQIVWGNEWDNETMNIPLAINMRIEYEDDTILQYLRRTSGSSFYSTYGKRDENKISQ